MERKTDILPFYSITECAIQEIVIMQNVLAGIKYWRDRQGKFAMIVESLSENANWLLTFSVWFTMYNPRFMNLVASNYYTIEPSNINKVTFVDFIKLIQKYNRKHITVNNEIHIVRFLSSCDKVHFKFYLSLLSKEFVNTIPTAEVHSLLDLGTINVEDVYGKIELLQTDFSELSYPVSIRLMHDPDFKLSVYAKEPRRTFSFYQYKNKLKYTKDLLTTDKMFINTPRYTLVGYSDIRTIQHRRKTEDIIEIYPVDYFDTFLEFRRYKRGSKKIPAVDYKERMVKLQKFLDNNYTRQVHKTEILLAENEYELIQRVLELCPDKGAGYLIITDKDTARIGKAHAIPVVSTFGIIENIWLEQGIAKGFNIWFNGALTKCPFEFSGANNALLNNPELVHQKMLEITSIRIGTASVIIGKQIHWEKLRWRIYRHKGVICVEKCALCGGTHKVHKRQGLCKSCECMLGAYYDTHGTKWIRQTNLMRVKRLNSGWVPEMLTNLGVFFRDSYLEARYDGSWRFRRDNERAVLYKRYMERGGCGRTK